MESNKRATKSWLFTLLCQITIGFFKIGKLNHYTKYEQIRKSYLPKLAFVLLCFAGKTVKLNIMIQNFRFCSIGFKFPRENQKFG